MSLGVFLAIYWKQPSVTHYERRTPTRPNFTYKILRAAVRKVGISERPNFFVCPRLDRYVPWRIIFSIDEHVGRTSRRIMPKRRQSETSSLIHRYPGSRLAHIPFDQLFGFSEIISGPELLDRLLLDGELMGLARSWLRLHATPKLSSDLPELLTELSHEQATTLFGMLSDAPDEAARSFAEPPFPSRDELGKVVRDGQGSPRLVATHEPSESAGRLYLPSFRVYIPYLASRTYVKERWDDAPADAYSMTPAKDPSAVMLRDYMPGLINTLLTGEEFARHPHPTELGRLGLSEIATDLSNPAVRITDLRLATDVRSQQLRAKLPTYLNDVGKTPLNAGRVGQWKRKLLGDEDSLKRLESDFRDRETAVISISFAAAALLLLCDLSYAARVPLSSNAHVLTERVAELASCIGNSQRSFKDLLLKSSEQLGSWAGLADDPEEDRRKTHRGEKLIALWAYRLGHPKDEIARYLGISTHYKGGKESTRWRAYLWDRLEGGMQHERNLYPEFGELFEIYEQDLEAQFVALTAYRLWLSVILELHPRSHLRLCSIRKADRDTRRAIKGKIVSALRQEGINLKTARKLVNNVPSLLDERTFEEEEVQKLKRILGGLGAEVKAESVALPPVLDLKEHLHGNVAEKKRQENIEDYRKELSLCAKRGFYHEKLQDTVYLMATNLERDHRRYATLDDQMRTEKVNLKTDAVEEHAAFWRRMATELYLGSPRSAAARHSAQAYVQLGSCLVQGIPFYPERESNRL